jgi:hypothetical protein
MHSYSSGMRPQQQKKDVLWNVQEPGDPYDIKKYL